MNAHANHARPRSLPVGTQWLWWWSALWLLMALSGLDQNFGLPGYRPWQGIVFFVSSALAATAIALIQFRRCTLTTNFRNLWHWFRYTFAWMPLQTAAFVAFCFAVKAMIGVPWWYGPWSRELPGDVASFVLVYGVTSGIWFGVHSYRVCVSERIRADRQEKLAQLARLAQLTQQLQPHFLFNTLNTVSSLIHSEPDTADMLLASVATLLRAATDSSKRPEQPLANELELLRAYADIMETRFSERMSLSWDIDPNALNCQVPTLGLQPLLENCFRHVVEPRSKHTHLVVRAVRDSGVLRIDIEDDGDRCVVPRARGVGLGNLEERLHSLYGALASLSLVARPDGGMVARVELPCAR
ncbi:sensor histidine kinase [Paraburkholderia megapolitana]|uniref:Histidine kinase n=2 Tax=Paraburkholderia megapolitana TaxID=420953 RepID=A0A1I3MWG2_9BURK|nr:sensor histidine kinase [Paraburkholderia megapolitana]SFJ01272.1 Histidine kinase [Paraburkholderia megapolitana]